MAKGKRTKSAKAKKAHKSTGKAKVKPSDTSLSRVEHLLSLLYVKGLQPTEAAMRLAAIGFSPTQIAPLLGKKPNTVNQLLFRARRAGQR